MLSTYGGRTNTPIVFDDLVIISGVTTGWDDTARPAHRFLAFDKSSGELVWQTSTRPLPEDTTYSTPVIRVIDGQAVMVAGEGDGQVYGIQPRTGKILWKEQLSRRGINTSVAIDGLETFTRLTAKKIPRNHDGGCRSNRRLGRGPRLGVIRAVAHRRADCRQELSPVGWRSAVCRRRLLAVARLGYRDRCRSRQADQTGNRDAGSLLYADGMIYAGTSSGIFHVLQPTSDGVESIFKVRLPRGEEVGGSPIVSHRRLYLPTTRGLYCLGDGGVPAMNLSLTSAIPAAETERSGDDTVAQLQLVPAEAFLSAGQEFRPRVVAFNARGQRLDRLPEDLKWELLGSGSIDSDGVFHAESSDEHRAAVVTVASGSIKATSRLRIVPPLPWNFDFSDGQVPITCIGARYRHEARQIDGDPAIVKISTIPKGTRSQTWFGPTDLNDYTITADVKAAGGTAKMPDIGVIAQRYTLDLMGESQQLQFAPGQLNCGWHAAHPMRGRLTSGTH